MKPALLLAACFTGLLQSACSRSNNLLLGRVESAVGTHTVVVTDCYQFSVPPPQRLAGAPEGQPAYRFTPCRDADIQITGAALLVNGRSYGALQKGDGVLVDHGMVYVRHPVAHR